MILTLAWVAAVSAVAAYYLGCLNGAIITSHTFYGEDIREKGSGNAGLTNFYRVYGKRHIALVLLVDVLKAVLAVLLGGALFRWQLDGAGFGTGVLNWRVAHGLYGAYWAALWVIVGHNYPYMHKFRGGKGILCAGTLLILLDWRIALVGWGTFILLAALTSYVSLGSVAGTVTFPMMTFFIFREQDPYYILFALSLITAAIVVWAHRGNIQRLAEGNERKFRFHRDEEKTEDLHNKDSENS